MPTRCTEAATCSGIRNSWPPGCIRAGKPDKPDRTSGPELVLPSKLSRSSKSPKPECASQPPSGQARRTTPFAPKMPFALRSAFRPRPDVQIATRQALLFPVNSRSRVGARSVPGRQSCEACARILHRGRARRISQAACRRPTAHTSLRSISRITPCLSAALRLDRNTRHAHSKSAPVWMTAPGTDGKGRPSIARPIFRS
jgi:hypothetical protein